MILLEYIINDKIFEFIPYLIYKKTNIKFKFLSYNYYLY